MAARRTTRVCVGERCVRAECGTPRYQACCYWFLILGPDCKHRLRRSVSVGKNRAIRQQPRSEANLGAASDAYAVRLLGDAHSNNFTGNTGALGLNWFVLGNAHTSNFMGNARAMGLNWFVRLLGKADTINFTGNARAMGLNWFVRLLGKAHTINFTGNACFRLVATASVGATRSHPDVDSRQISDRWL